MAPRRDNTTATRPAPGARAPAHREYRPRAAKERVSSYAGQAGTSGSRVQKKQNRNTNNVPAGNQPANAAGARDKTLHMLTHNPLDPELFCEMCIHTKSIHDFPVADQLPSDCKDHFDAVCKRCITLYIRQSARHGQIPGCMFCGVTYDLSYLSNWLGHEETISIENKMFSKLVEMDADFRWCAQDTCLSGQFYVPELAAKDPKVCCVECGKVNCFSCCAPWHEGLTCADYQVPEIREAFLKQNGGYHSTLKAMRRGMTKKCPYCGWGIQKHEGCDHMTCTNCSRGWSWDEAAAV